MKRLVAGIMGVLAMLAIAGVGVQAAPAVNTTAAVGPYEGVFYGYVHGDKDSKAPLILVLTHRGNQVQGDVYLGEGLYVSGGVCGEYDVPGVVQTVAGTTDVKDPKRLVVTPTFEVGGFELSVDFESNISADGDSVTAEAGIDLPWFCGSNPSLTTTLLRYR